jgi:hypothetical protein
MTKSVFSYFWLIENIFFNVYSVLNWFYFYEPTSKIMRDTKIDVIFVFFAFWIREIIIPRTTMRLSHQKTSNKKEENVSWWNNATLLTRVMYLHLKHYQYFFYLYLRYLNVLNENDIKYLYMMYLAEGWGLVVSMYFYIL